jgi:hypothetical protein
MVVANKVKHGNMAKVYSYLEDIMEKNFIKWHP